MFRNIDAKQGQLVFDTLQSDLIAQMGAFVLVRG